MVGQNAKSKRIKVRWARAPLCRLIYSFLVGEVLSPHQLAGDDDLLDLGGAVADLEADHVAQALLQGKVLSIAVLTVEEEAIVDAVHGDLRRPPLRHCRFFGVRVAGVA